MPVSACRLQREERCPAPRAADRNDSPQCVAPGRRTRCGKCQCRRVRRLVIRTRHATPPYHQERAHRQVEPTPRTMFEADSSGRSTATTPGSLGPRLPDHPPCRGESDGSVSDMRYGAAPRSHQRARQAPGVGQWSSQTSQVTSPFFGRRCGRIYVHGAHARGPFRPRPERRDAPPDAHQRWWHGQQRPRPRVPCRGPTILRW